MNCCNPKRITFRTAEGGTFRILAPCRHCYACEQKLRAEWTLRINADMTDRFVVFVTLTYSDDKAHTICKSAKKNLTGADLSPFTLVSKTDASKLLKTLQTALKKHTGDKHALFRYALNAEYGDNTHRAHMHLVLGFPRGLGDDICQSFCTDYLGFQHLKKSSVLDGMRDPNNKTPTRHMCKVWPFGHVVTQYAYTTKNVATYVSKHCVKFCVGTDAQNQIAPIFRKTSVYGGGLGVNDMCNDPKVIDAYNNGLPLLSDGIKDGKPVMYRVGVPMAVRRRLHPQRYTDNEMDYKVTSLNNLEAKSVSEYAAECGALTSEHLQNPVDSLESLRPVYYNALTISDMQNRNKTNEHRLIEKRKNGGYVH